ncbi:MAG: prepilin peptidase [Micropruina sp.]|uniref:prepilin peptidase n=1 Tax=Micropruina sp. TaxID=2737536 RepID=UPI0039E5615B
MGMSWVLLLPALFAGCLAVASPAILRALPPPVDEPESDPYRRLATRAIAGTVFLLVTAAGTVVVTMAPTEAPAWFGLAGPAVLAAVVDARTGYLPKRLVQASWALTAAGLLVTVAPLGPGVLLRAGLGAAAASALFWVFWRFGGGFGYGDVRLAPVIGAAAAAVSWPLLAASLLFGGLLGVAWGLLWQASGRGRAFPYGPALVAGPFLALAASPLLPGLVAG